MLASIDIEPTNRCNASCDFCPRDQTPHQGLMSPETFGQALARTVELVDRIREIRRPEFNSDIEVSLCGLGEPLLNRRTPEFVRLVREAGLRCSLTTNAALLDAERGAALLEAGLQRVCINVGEVDDEYERIYELPFPRTRDNILRFAEMAGEQCEVVIVLVDHRRDPDHLRAMRSYWRALGLNRFVSFDLMNRGGSLSLDHMQYEAMEQRAEARELLSTSVREPLCMVPFAYLFIGYDGQYYLCCSDWKKETPLGSVYDRSFADVMFEKLALTRSRRPVCETCNGDPLNSVTSALADRDEGIAGAPEVSAVIDRIAFGTAVALDVVEVLTGAKPPAQADSPGPRMIPVRSV